MTAPTADRPVQLARYSNALTGLAAGDAWGYQSSSPPTLRCRPTRCRRLRGEWIISDDTQMTLALHDALTEVADFDDIEAVTAAIVRHFTLWKLDPRQQSRPRPHLHGITVEPECWRALVRPGRCT